MNEAKPDSLTQNLLTAGAVLVALGALLLFRGAAGGTFEPGFRIIMLPGGVALLVAGGVQALMFGKR